jgi:phosphohistidine phosphatase
MRRVYLIRHGIAVPPGSTEFPDAERPLTEEGIARMKQVARGLARLEFEVERIVSSPLPRALQTARIVAAALGSAELVEDDASLSANRSAEAIAGWLAERQESSLALVGHNPAFSELVPLLVLGMTAASMCDLKRGGVAALVSDGPGAPYRIDWLARPRLLRRIGR